MRTIDIVTGWYKLHPTSRNTNIERILVLRDNFKAKISNVRMYATVIVSNNIIGFANSFDILVANIWDFGKDRQCFFT